MTKLNFRLIAVFSVLTGGALSMAQSSVARAQGGGNAFGAPGEFAVTGELEGHLQKGWELRLHPALDYFIANNVSIGGLIGIQYDSPNGGTTTIDLGVRAGYNLNIVNQVSFWPTLGIFYSHFSASMSSGSSTSLGVFAPFLYHITPHFFLGGGPFFNLPLDSGGNNYGLRTVVGGWF